MAMWSNVGAPGLTIGAPHEPAQNKEVRTVVSKASKSCNRLNGEVRLEEYIASAHRRLSSGIKSAGGLMQEISLSHGVDGGPEAVEFTIKGVIVIRDEEQK